MLVVLAALAGPRFLAAGQTQAEEEKLFQDVKILVFDEKWAAAENALDDLLARFPRSPFVPQALYYRAKCIEEQGGREREAVRAFGRYLELKDRNANLAEDAERAVIDLALKLNEAGDHSFLKDVESRLSHPDKAVRYYAAIKLSGVKDRALAGRCVPVLKSIVAEEKNAELRDRAKIALLRVDPEALKDMDERPAERRARVFHIQVFDEASGRASLSINIPWALADLALSAIPDDEKRALRAKGYEINKILDALKSIGSIVEIHSEGKHIKIWID